MAEKKERDEKQYQKFLEKVQELEDAGELSPTEADKAMERVMKMVAHGGVGKKSS